MVLIYCDTSEDLSKKSVGRAALNSVDLVDMMGGGAEGCYGKGWVLQFFFFFFPPLTDLLFHHLHIGIMSHGCPCDSL